MEMRLLAGVVALVFWAAQSGCVTSRAPSFPPPPSEGIRSTFGRVGVTWVSEGPPPMLTIPAGGSCAGSARGALIGTYVGFELIGTLQLTRGSGGNSLGVFLALCLLAASMALIPLTVLIGSLYGASAAHPSEEVDAAILSVSRAASDPDLPRRIARTILERGGARTDESLAWLEPGGSREHFDSVLEVGPPAVSLIGPYQINPSLQLTAVFPVTLVRLSDGALLYQGAVGWQGTHRKDLFQRAEGEGAQIRSLLEREGSAFAERVVEQVFLLHLLPLEREWKAGTRGPVKR